MPELRRRAGSGGWWPGDGRPSPHTRLCSRARSSPASPPFPMMRDDAGATGGGRQAGRWVRCAGGQREPGGQGSTGVWTVRLFGLRRALLWDQCALLANAAFKTRGPHQRGGRCGPEAKYARSEALACFQAPRPPDWTARRCEEGWANGLTSGRPAYERRWPLIARLPIPVLVLCRAVSRPLKAHILQQAAGGRSQGWHCVHSATVG